MRNGSPWLGTPGIVAFLGVLSTACSEGLGPPDYDGYSGEVEGVEYPFEGALGPDRPLARVDVRRTGDPCAVAFRVVDGTAVHSRDETGGWRDLRLGAQVEVWSAVEIPEGCPRSATAEALAIIHTATSR